MPSNEAPNVDLDRPQTPSGIISPAVSEISSASSPEPQSLRTTPLFRVLAMPPPDPEQPPFQEELERRLPGYRRIVIPRELTLIELLKQSSGATTDEEVLQIREVKLRVVAERVGLRRLNVLAPLLRSLTLDGSALSSLRDLGIGLVHLKILSVNRCGLTCLDGVWGLSALRELHAAGNRLQDLQALAALQKLHTLDLANNPIADSSRLWMLGVCGALRRLSLEGTPAANEPDYRTIVADALPMLNYLDDHPLHVDFEYGLQDANPLGSGSSSDSEAEAEPPVAAVPKPTTEPEPGPSTLYEDIPEDNGDDSDCNLGSSLEVDKMRLPHLRRRRPATTEGAGQRPQRPKLPRRPKTAHERPSIDAPTRLQILNTLMDEEWRCSGSKLTSHIGSPVCGNLAQALRRPVSSAHQRRLFREKQLERELMERSFEVAEREVVEEIPTVPNLDSWTRFREKTGIDIDIASIIERPQPQGAGDVESAIDRLDRIEKETLERLSNPIKENKTPAANRTSFACATSFNTDFHMWRMENLAPIQGDTHDHDIESLFSNLAIRERQIESPSLNPPETVD